MGSLSIWHWLIVLLIVVAVFFAVISFAKHNKDPDRTLSGIGGWLVLPILGFIGTFLVTFYNLVSAFLEIEGLKNIFSSQGGPLIQLRGPMLASILIGSFVCFSALAALYKIFVVRSGVVNIATIHYVGLVFAAFADLWLDSTIRSIAPSTPYDPAPVRDAIKSFLIALIWVPYFRLSQRVRNTFEISDQQMISREGASKATGSAG